VSSANTTQRRRHVWSASRMVTRPRSGTAGQNAGTAGLADPWHL